MCLFRLPTGKNIAAYEKQTESVNTANQETQEVSSTTEQARGSSKHQMPELQEYKPSKKLR